MFSPLVSSLPFDDEITRQVEDILKGLRLKHH